MTHTTSQLNRLLAEDPLDRPLKLLQSLLHEIRGAVLIGDLGHAVSLFSSHAVRHLAYAASAADLGPEAFERLRQIRAGLKRNEYTLKEARAGHQDAQPDLAVLTEMLELLAAGPSVETVRQIIEALATRPRLLTIERRR
jgi:hypothetical protein